MPSTRFLIITLISEYKNDSNTQRFEMNKTKFIDNESSNNYEMFNTNYQDIRMESIILVTSRKLKKNAPSTRSTAHALKTF